MALRVVALLSCLVFLLSLASFASVATSEEVKCFYLLRIKTKDELNAVTNSKISLILISSTGYSIINENNLERWGRMPAGHDYFEHNFLILDLPCFKVCGITIISDGKGLIGSGWYLEYVEIRTHSQRNTSMVNKWLVRNEEDNSLYAHINLCPGSS